MPTIIQPSKEELASGLLCDETLFEALRSFHRDGFLVMENIMDTAKLDGIRDFLLEEGVEIKAKAVPHKAEFNNPTREQSFDVDGLQRSVTVSLKPVQETSCSHHPLTFRSLARTCFTRIHSCSKWSMRTWVRDLNSSILLGTMHRVVVRSVKRSTKVGMCLHSYQVTPLTLIEIVLSYIRR